MHARSPLDAAQKHGRARVRAERLAAALVLLVGLAACAQFQGGQQLTPAPLPADAGTLSATPPRLVPTGTVVDGRVQQLGSDLGSLKGGVVDNAQEFRVVRAAMADQTARYQTLVGNVTARLQVGTTPGNPELIAQLNEAQGLLGQLDQNLSRLSGLSTRVASNASSAGFLQNSIRSAFRLSGGIDQDHRNLDALEDDTSRTIVTIDRLLNEITDDISRQSAAVASERRTIGSLGLAINSGRMFGAPLSQRIATSPALQPRPAPAAATRRPLVTIRFDRPDVAYRQPLYEAVSSALDRNPGVAFELVGIAPARGEPADQARAASEARRQAEGVARALVEMGLPSERVILSAATRRDVPATEVQVFIR
ncbi:hypothetical protein [Elioraea sp.]|uniref:hypothetical protein n=1 Tax=Elioraea sp. TaxID=2185103 RepID=UPI0025BDCCAF|nr:hypothetical protein [Elioraea sp.]